MRTPARSASKSRPTRSIIDRLFKKLRERGFKTIEGDICCGGCAAAQLATDGEDGQPGAFYHEQDVENGYDEVYVGFGVIGGELDEASAEVGRTIVDVAEDMGIDTEWEGNPARRILLKP